MPGLLAAIVIAEITEAYDLVESILNRISLTQEGTSEVRGALTRAKDALFEARTLTDGEQ